MNLFVLNIFIALSWFFLADTPGPSAFFYGFLIGFIMIAILRPIFDEASYIKKHFYKDGTYITKTLHFILFIFWFLKEFLVANIRILWAVLTRPNSKIHPNIFTLDITDLSTFEIIILSQCITLTPGTTTIKVSSDQNTLFVHAFDGEETQQERNSIELGLKKKILSFTR